MAEAVAEGIESTLEAMVPLWLNTPTLDGRQTVYWIQDQLGWLISLVAVFGVIIAGAKMAWEGRGQPARDLVRSLITLIFAVAMSAEVLYLLLRASDSFADWIIDRSTQGEGFSEGLSGALLTTASGLSPILVIFLGLAIIGSNIIQMLLLIARSGIVILLAGILPLSATATHTQPGKAWFSKVLGWMLGWILYKPAAALVYAVAFRIPQEEGSLLGAVVSLTMMVMAIVALPALMRLAVPMVGGLAAGGGTAGAGAALAGGGAMAGHMLSGGPTGAKPTPPMQPSVSMAGGGASGASGGQGASGPQGPSGAGPTSSPATAGGMPSGAAATSSGGGGAASGAGGAAAKGAATGAGGAATGGATVAAQAGMSGAKKAGETAKKVSQQAPGETGDDGPSGNSGQ